MSDTKYVPKITLKSLQYGAVFGADLFIRKETLL